MGGGQGSRGGGGCNAVHERREKINQQDLVPECMQKEEEASPEGVLEHRTATSRDRKTGASRSRGGPEGDQGQAGTRKGEEIRWGTGTFLALPKSESLRGLESSRLESDMVPYLQFVPR